jgi:hypothetical protein
MEWGGIAAGNKTVVATGNVAVAAGNEAVAPKANNNKKVVALQKEKLEMKQWQQLVTKQL